MKKKPTSFDVAERAGVHRSVVSRALSGSGRMSDETRQKVIEAAKDLGYRVNFLARGLQNQSSGLIGLVASRLDTPYRAQQVKVAAREILKSGFCPLLITADGSETITGLMSRLLNYNVSGMIVTSDTPPVEIIRECEQLSVPVVLINRDTSVTGADRVQLDVEDAGKLAFDMLMHCAATSPAVLMPQRETYTVSGRAGAFARRCADAGLPVTVLRPEGQDYKDGLMAADLLVQEGARVDALFGATDLLSLGLLDGLRHVHGVQVPQEMQLVGFDDIPQAGWLGYNLSTVRQDSADTAVQAVDLILARIEAPGRPLETRNVALEPVFRGTTCRQA